MTTKQSVATSLHLVEVRKDKPFTTTLAVAEGCRLTHESVIKLVRKYLTDFEEFGSLRFEIQKSGGRPTEYGILNEDQATYLVTLFRNNEVVRGFKVRLVKAFRSALNEIERLTQQRGDPAWQLVRDETKLGFKWMNATLKEMREAEGKATTAHHYQNEARMINAVLAGKHGKLDRHTLSEADLALMAELQRLNAVLIAQNLTYRDRKAVLMDRAIRKLAA